MESAVAIVICMVLYLIDKNQKWKAFAKLCIVAVVLAVIGFGYSYYTAHRKVTLDMSTAVPISSASQPSTTPAKSASGH